MKVQQIIVALAIGAVALPVSAAQPAANPKAATPAAAEKKYCIQYDDITGSRVRKMECKTKAQWAREGINVDQPASTRD